MAIPQDLLNEITNALGTAITPSLNTASAADDLFEAYLFSLVIQAAQLEGATSIRFLDRSGNTPTVFVFRTSPGYINSSAQNYSHAEIGFPNKPVLEAHIGIRVAGQSSVLHECDVCVLLKAEADLCRFGWNRIAPRSSKVIIAVEAKYYTSSLGLYLGRGFLGLTSDLSADKSIFVSNTTSQSVEKLLASKRKLWERNIVPGNVNDVDRLRITFQTAFKDFNAKY